MGLSVNARIANHIYYALTIRFHGVLLFLPSQTAKRRRTGAQIVLVEDPALQAVKPMWRFLASDDTTIDQFLCRDAD